MSGLPVFQQALHLLWEDAVFAQPRPWVAAVHSSPLLGILKRTRRRRVWGLCPAQLPRLLPCPPPRGFPLAAFLVSVLSVHKPLVITHAHQSLCRGTPERCSLEVCLTSSIDSHSPPAWGALMEKGAGASKGRVCVCVWECECLMFFISPSYFHIYFSISTWVSCSVMSDPLRHQGPQPTRLLCPWNSSCKNTKEGSHFLRRGIFLTQGLNPGLLHCRQILYCLSHHGLVSLSIFMSPIS